MKRSLEVVGREFILRSEKKFADGTATSHPIKQQREYFKEMFGRYPGSNDESARD